MQYLIKEGFTFYYTTLMHYPYKGNAYALDYLLSYNTLNQGSSHLLHQCNTLMGVILKDCNILGSMQ